MGVERPRYDLDFRHSVECFWSFDIAFEKDEVMTKAQRSVEALASAVYYMCSYVPTIGSRYATLPLTLAELGVFYIRADSPIAQPILRDPSRY